MKKFSFRIMSNNLSGREEAQTFLSSLVVALVIFAGFPAYYTYATATALSVNVSGVMTFSVTTDNFVGNLTPSTPKYATSTLSMYTGSVSGYNVILSCDSKTTDYCMRLGGEATTQLTDKTSWSVGAAAATTTTGTAASITSGDDVLAFRVMTASGTQDFKSTTWWGTADGYPGSGTTLWAGIASSTNASRIGAVSWYTASTNLNTVLYYLDVPITQKSGTYTGNLTYTATSL